MICEQCGFTNAPDARFCILCGGALTFAGTDMQADKNVQDSNELLKKDLFKVGENVNDPVQVQAYLDNQLETYHWLKKIGVTFERWKANKPCALLRQT